VAEVANVTAAIQEAYGPQALGWWTMQKLLYFCQGWSLAWTGNPLFRDGIEAWKNGPVVREVYRVQRHYPLTPPGSADALTSTEQETVREVVRFYGRYTAAQLIALTHREPPWRDARNGVAADDSCRNPISHQALRDYFSKLAAVPKRIPDSLRRTIDVLLNVPEEQSQHLLTDSGIDFDAELAYLRGQGANPWPSQNPNQH
jgi:uncharacterized phage-associated protein